MLLPVQLQRHLQLPRIEGCCRRSRLRVKRIDIGDIEAIYKIENVEDAVQSYALGQTYPAADAKIGKDCRGPGAGITSKISRHRSIDETGCLQKSRRRVLRGHRFIAARIGRCSRGHDIGPVGVGAEVEVGIRTGKDRKRPAGPELDNRRNRPVTQKLTCGVARVHLAGLENRAPHEAMPLIEN